MEKKQLLLLILGLVLVGIITFIVLEVTSSDEESSKNDSDITSEENLQDSTDDEPLPYLGDPEEVDDFVKQLNAANSAKENNKAE
ncbi:MAG: hypothetical protein Q9M91_07185 [Candidatus Dojkabacteria bacterium]|nr:hypothetical protein [Candidatus Dojkabacteria bacterium]MDQ7021575.1 hypothetical protein [Candidatus Dojkabacteria bacterium]